MPLKRLSLVLFGGGVFRGDTLSPPLSIIAMMMLLTYTLKKCQRGYKLIKSYAKINHLMKMDDILQMKKN